MREIREHPYIPKLKEQLCDAKIGRREFLRTSTLLGMSATAAYAFAGKVTGQSLVSPARAQQLPQGGTLKIGMRVQEVTNPHALNWLQPANITTNVVQQLTRTGQDNITRPLLAESWEASDDLKTWTISLRKDAKWRKGGRPFTADDVIWNINHVLDPATGSSSIGLMKAYMLEDVDTGEKDKDGKPVMSTKIWDANAIEKVDDLTVRLNLKIPQVAIPEHLFHYTNAMIDPEEGGVFGPGANGTGPFELVELKVGEIAVLKPNPDYWGGAPNLDKLLYIDLGDDPSALIGALASKQVDGAYQLDVSAMDVMERLPHLVVHKATTAATAVLQMIITKEPYDNEKVRLALRYAIDPKETLKLSLRNVGLEAEHHFVAPIHPEYAALPEMSYDPEKAKAILKDAGYPDGIDIEMTAKKDPAWEIAAVQAMKQQCESAGFRMKINTMPGAQFWDVWDKVPLGFVEWAHRPLGFMVLSLGFRTGVPWNPTGFADKEFDDLLNVAEGTLDVEERREVMKKIEIIMQQRGPIAQPCWRGVVTAMDKRVKGFTMHPMSVFFGEELAVEA